MFPDNFYSVDPYTGLLSENRSSLLLNPTAGITTHTGSTGAQASSREYSNSPSWYRLITTSLSLKGR